MKKLLSKMNPRLKWRGIRGVRYNEDGVSAVEFALLAPFMMLVFFGCVELSFMMRADRRVTTTAASLGDLTARLAIVDNEEMGEMFAAAGTVLSPLDANVARMRLTSIVADDSGVTTVGWSDHFNMTDLADGSSITIPAGLVPPNGSVVMAEVEFTYNGVFSYYIKSERNLKDKFYMRPRRVNQIERVYDDDDDGSGFGPGAAP